MLSFDRQFYNTKREIGPWYLPWLSRSSIFDAPFLLIGSAITSMNRIRSRLMGYAVLAGH